MRLVVLHCRDHIPRSPRSGHSVVAAARALIRSTDGMRLGCWIIPCRMNRRCVAVGPCPISRRRNAESHHHRISRCRYRIDCRACAAPIQDNPTSRLKPIRLHA